MIEEMNLMPRDVALQLIAEHKGNHRAAEVHAWDLRRAHGHDTPHGRLLAKAAVEIAELYHNVPWNRSGEYTHHVAIIPSVQQAER